MRRNQKLTPILAGRVIQNVSQQTEAGQITFTDGSVLTLKLSASIPFTLYRTAPIKMIRQEGNQMIWEFADAASAEINLAEEASCLLLRDAQGALEYAD